LQPELLGNEYTRFDFYQRPTQKDIGKRMLYRDWYMTGWGYKTITPNDLKLPVVNGEGKRVSIYFIILNYARLCVRLGLTELFIIFLYE
jgi:protein phosphatase 1H